MKKHLLPLAALVALSPLAHAGFIYFAGGTFYIDDDGNGTVDRTVAIPTYQPTDYPLVGDWNGDGVDEIGFCRAGGTPGAETWTWNLSANNTDFSTLYTTAFINGEQRNVGAHAASYLFPVLSDGEEPPTLTYTQPRDIPIVGDWNGDGTDQIGLFRWNSASSINWILFDGNTGSAGVSNTFVHGGPNQPDLPLIGDPNGDGIDGAGLIRGNMSWLTNNSNTAGGVANAFGHGNNVAGNFDRPTLGDWDDDGSDEVMMFRQNSMEWLLSSAGDGSDLVNTVIATDLNSAQGVAIGDVSHVWFANTVSTAAPTIVIEINGSGDVVITYDGGTLKSRTDLSTGSWTTVPGATSPYTKTPSGDEFFRVEQ